MAQPQNVKCSDPVDTTELHFKLVKRNDAVKYAEKPTYANLLAVAHTFGLTFLGANDGFQVMKTDSVSSENYPRKFVKSQCRFVTHLTVNGDESLLAVGGSLGADGCVAYIYPLSTISDANYLQESNRVKLSPTPGVSIVEMSWNPASFRLLSACLSDGSIALVDIKSSTSMEFNSLPANAAARCFCWSPKGKQLVVGGEDGKLTQYKPDLTPAKSLPAPNAFGGAVSVASVIWISNFQFGAVYRHRNQPDASPTFVIVNAFKNEPVTFIHYDDVTYGSGQFRFPQFYFYHQPQWNLLLVASANSVEVAVLHLGQDGRTWEQWVIGDSSRAEMPLTADQDETFPYGMAVDLSSQTPVAWVETHLPPAPRLLLVSNFGVLCLYNIVNLVQNSPVICAGPGKPVAGSFFDTPVVIQQQQQQQSEPIVESPPVAEIPTPSQVKPIVVKVKEAEAEVVPQVVKEEPQEKEQSPPSPVKEPEPEVDDSVYDAAIIEEVVALDDELASLFSELSCDERNELGPSEEFSDVVRNLENFAEFQKDVDETTQGQWEETSELKFEVLELLAKSQDARLVRERRNNQFGNQLQRSEHLDPVLARILREILGLRTFVENQLKQLSTHLDKQWEEHQQACRKDAKARMQTPLMEDIYNTINLIKKLLISEKSTVDRLEKEIDRGVWRKRSEDTRHDGSRATDLSKLADSLLGMSIETSKPDVSKLVVDAKRQNIDKDELTAQEVAVLFDRFEDAPVPEVSHCLNFADREAHKKEVEARLKAAVERMNKSEKERMAAKPKPTKLITTPVAEKLPKAVPVAREIFASKPVPAPEPARQNTIGLFGQQPTSERSILKVTPEVAKTVASTSAFSFASSGNKSLFSMPGLFKSGSSVTITPVSFGKVQQDTVKPQESAPKPLFSVPVETPVVTKPAVFEEKKNVPVESKKSTTVTITPVDTKTTSSTSLFGSVSITPVSTTTGLFSNISSPPVTATSTGNVFAATTKSLFSPGQGLFGNSTVATTTPLTITSETKTAPSTVATTTTSSLFGTSTTTSSLFGGIVSSPATTLFGGTTVTSASPSLFGLTPTSTAAFGKTSSLFGAPTTTASTSLFTASTVPSTTSSSFSSTTSAGLFGSNSATITTTTSTNVFGASSTTTPSSGLFSSVSVASTVPTSSVFGSTVTTSSAGLFSSTLTSTTTTTTATNVFGSNVTTSSSGLFGSAPTSVTSATTATSVFGSTVTTSSSGLFGSTPTSATTTTIATSVFGSTATTSSSGLFSSTPTNATTATTGSIFGSTPATTSTGLFGTSSTTTTTSSSVFGTPLFSTPTTTTATGLFGSFTQTPATTSAAVFGTPTMPTATSGFGTDINQTTNLFGQMLSSSTPPSTPQTNIFGQTPQKSGFDSGGNIFGGGTPASTSSLFGSSTTNVFGQTTSPSISQTTNIFGQQTPTTSGSSFFGQNICSPFGSGAAAPNQSPFASPVAATTQSAFGSPSFNKPIFGQSVFGQSGSTSLFGGSPQQQSGSIFGGSAGGGSFQSSSFSGPFSSGGGTVAQSGFGAAPSFSKPTAGGFGSAPLFGGSPAGTAFGGTPAFGSTLPFGGTSPSKVFGGGTSPGFGQQQPSGFESIATQNTVGFGNLAQMPAQPQAFGPGFSSPQQNTFGAQPQQQQPSSFGGSSFSSWR